MDTRKIKAAAQLLLAARNHEISLTRLPQEHAPADVAEAYAIQDEVMQALGQVGGWKVTSDAGAAQPSCAPMPAQGIFAAATHFFDLATAGSHGVAVDMALRLKHDLPSRAMPYTRQDLLAAIATVHPAIALVSSRYTGSAPAEPLVGLADGLSHCAFIYGPGRSDLRQIDQGMQHSELYFNGLELGANDSGQPAPDIWPQLTWLANHLGGRCGGLKAGQFILIAASASAGRPALAQSSRFQANLAQRATTDVSLARA